MTWRRWDEAWHSALYGPRGFYRRSAPADHFATATQGLGHTGTLLAEALLALARRHRLHRIVEVAAGRGELLVELARHRAQDFTGVGELTGVDVVDRPEGLPAAVSWLRAPGGAALPSDLVGLTDTVLVAHEWLDVVPCPVASRDPDGTWRHVLIACDGSERPGPLVEADELHWLQTHVPPPVGRAEVGLTRDLAHADLVSRVDSGLVLVVDYGHTADARPPQGTLTGYRDGVQVPPVPDGSCDLTAHVAVDSLGADEVIRQREILHGLLGRPTLPPHALSRTDPTAYLDSLTRANALAALTTPAGLGSFWWAMTRRGGDNLG